MSNGKWSLHEEGIDLVDTYNRGFSPGSISRCLHKVMFGLVPLYSVTEKLHALHEFPLIYSISKVINYYFHTSKFGATVASTDIV